MKTNSLKYLRFGSLIFIAICSLTLTGAQSARAATNETRGQLSSSDYKFVVDAAQGGMAEVSLAQLAEQKAANPDVKQFAARMVQDHSKADQQLTQLASQKGATLPTAIPSSEQREMDRLRNLSGTDFDKAYMDHMVRDHKSDVKEFQRASKRAKDPDVKSFAASTLPTLEDHLRMAENLDTTVKGQKTSAPGM
ncbi:MAG: outer membrane protein [Pedosphaera sp.]|nr:outer membrane protein [Pedosphaera sp.]